MTEFNRKIDKFCSSHEEHVEHLPIIENALDGLLSISNELDVFDFERIGRPIVIKQIDYLLYSLADFSKGIVNSLSNRNYSTVESLSRISVEHAVNLLYVLGDDSYERAKSFIKAYAFESKRKAERWLNYSEKNDDKTAIDAAKRRIEYIDMIIVSDPNLFSKKTKGWPDAKARFRAVGLEESYHTLFASASNAVHTLSEDVFNVTIIDSYPEAFKDRALRAFLAEKVSFAYYLASNALTFHAEAIAQVAKKLDDIPRYDKTSEVASSVVDLIREHEELSACYRES